MLPPLIILCVATQIVLVKAFKDLRAASSRIVFTVVVCTLHCAEILCSCKYSANSMVACRFYFLDVMGVCCCKLYSGVSFLDFMGACLF